MELSEAASRCRKLMEAHGLGEHGLKFVDNPRDYDGRWDGSTIEINAARISEAEDICLHEIAHALTEGEADGGRQHGPKWAEVAWRIAGKPLGGSGRCPQPKLMHHKMGTTTYFEVLQSVLEEARGCGLVDEQESTLTVIGDDMSSPLPEYRFTFHSAHGDVLITTPKGLLYVNAGQMQSEIEAVHLGRSDS